MEDYFQTQLRELESRLRHEESLMTTTRREISQLNQDIHSFKMSQDKALGEFASKEEAREHVNLWKKNIRRLERKRPTSPVIYIDIMHSREGHHLRRVGTIDETTQLHDAEPTDIQKQALTALGDRIEFLPSGSFGYISGSPREQSPYMVPSVHANIESQRSRAIQRNKEVSAFSPRAPYTPISPRNLYTPFGPRSERRDRPNEVRGGDRSTRGRSKRRGRSKKKRVVDSGVGKVTVTET